MILIAIITACYTSIDGGSYSENVLFCIFKKIIEKKYHYLSAYDCTDITSLVNKQKLTIATQTKKFENSQGECARCRNYSGKEK